MRNTYNDFTEITSFEEKMKELENSNEQAKEDFKKNLPLIIEQLDNLINKAIKEGDKKSEQVFKDCKAQISNFAQKL